MKKCPYCFSLMNNDSKACPKCLKLMDNVLPMKEVSPKDKRISFYSLVLGLIISIGSVLAALSQKINAKNYLVQYDDVVSGYNASNEESVRLSLQKQGEALMSNIKTCQFREISFYILCGIGALIVIYTLVKFLILKHKKN